MSQRRRASLIPQTSSLVKQRVQNKTKTCSISEKEQELDNESTHATFYQNLVSGFSVANSFIYQVLMERLAKEIYKIEMKKIAKETVFTCDQYVKNENVQINPRCPYSLEQIKQRSQMKPDEEPPIFEIEEKVLAKEKAQMIQKQEKQKASILSSSISRGEQPDKFQRSQKRKRKTPVNQSMESTKSSKSCRFSKCKTSARQLIPLRKEKSEVTHTHRNLQDILRDKKNNDLLRMVKNNYTKTMRSINLKIIEEEEQQFSYPIKNKNSQKTTKDLKSIFDLGLLKTMGQPSEMAQTVAHHTTRGQYNFDYDGNDLPIRKLPAIKSSSRIVKAGCKVLGQSQKQKPDKANSSNKKKNQRQQKQVLNLTQANKSEKTQNFFSKALTCRHDLSNDFKANIENRMLANKIVFKQIGNSEVSFVQQFGQIQKPPRKSIGPARNISFKRIV